MRVPFGIFSHSSLGRCWRRWLVELCLLIALLLLATQLVHSEPTSTPQEPLWSALLQQSSSLPQAIDDYAKAWMEQVDLLQSSNELLRASVASLQGSNSELTQQNAGLQTSLEASQLALATSESARGQLQTSLADSLQSITQAQAETEKVSRELAIWKVSAVVAGVLAVIAGAAVILR